MGSEFKKQLTMIMTRRKKQKHAVINQDAFHLLRHGAEEFSIEHVSNRQNSHM